MYILVPCARNCIKEHFGIQSIEQSAKLSKVRTFWQFLKQSVPWQQSLINEFYKSTQYLNKDVTIFRER